MIIRILTEGQYEVDGAALEHLHELDAEVMHAVHAGEEQRFHDSFCRLLDVIRQEGRALDDDDLRASELMLPPSDTTLAEAREEFTGEGLIPD